MAYREMLAGRPTPAEAQGAHAGMRTIGCPPPGSEGAKAEKACVDARDRDAFVEACGSYAKLAPEPDAKTAAAAKADLDKAMAEVRREPPPNLEKNLAYYDRRCAQGDKSYCEAAICGRMAVDDSDANLVACTRARGLKVGNGWVATSHGEPIPGIPRPDWSIGIVCMRKVGGDRPSATIWRKFGVPESAFDLQSEATKACEAKYAEARGRARP